MMRLRLAGVAFMYSPSLFKLIFGADIESLSKLTNKVSGWPWASPIDCRVRCDALLTGMTPLLAKSRAKKRPDLKQRKTY